MTVDAISTNADNSVLSNSSVLRTLITIVGESTVLLYHIEQEAGELSPDNIREVLETIRYSAARGAIHARRDERRYFRAQQEAITDSLTGLYNRRHFSRRLAEEVARSRRYGQPCSLLLADLDDFKSYNDYYGHPVGDAILRELADVLRGAVRKVDTVARYGGEEFAVVLPETNAERAMFVARRIRRKVEEYDFGLPGHSVEGSTAHLADRRDDGIADVPDAVRHAASADEDYASTPEGRVQPRPTSRDHNAVQRTAPRQAQRCTAPCAAPSLARDQRSSSLRVQRAAPYSRAGNRIALEGRASVTVPDRTVTLSIGLATYPQDAGDVEALIRSADAALIQVKQRGKNRVYAAGSVEHESRDTGEGEGG